VTLPTDLALWQASGSIKTIGRKVIQENKRRFQRRYRRRSLVTIVAVLSPVNRCHHVTVAVFAPVIDNLLVCHTRHFCVKVVATACRHLKRLRRRRKEP
jgi:hypothetical protein